MNTKAGVLEKCASSESVDRAESVERTDSVDRTNSIDSIPAAAAAVTTATIASGQSTTAQHQAAPLLDDRRVTPLCDGQVDAEGMVVTLAARDNHEVQKLMAIGILPGTTVRLIRCYPAYVIQVGYSQYAIDHSLAEIINVRWKPHQPYSAT